MTFRDAGAYNATNKIKSVETSINNKITSIQSLGGLVVNNNSGTSNGSHILINASHIGKMISSISGVANVVRVQPGISPYVGAHFHLLQYGAGKMEIRAGSGVTIRATTGISANLSGGVIFIRTQYASATVINISTNEWVVVGDLIGQ